MIPHETFIDTIGLQIDLDSAEIKQQETLYRLIEFVMNLKPLFVKKKQYNIGAFNNISKIEYLVYCNMGFTKTVVASINSGVYAVVDPIERRAKNKYYISVQFAGLKSRNDQKDFLSRMYLDIICAYFNKNNIQFKINTLDIGVDVLCKFDHMLVACTKKTPNTKYHQLGEIQLFQGETTWIEQFETNEQVNNATVRSYYYDKRIKYFQDFGVDLGYDLSRFEIKIQPKAFQGGFSIDITRKQLNRYHIMHFLNINDKYSKIAKYNNYTSVKEREIQRLGFDNYKLYPNADFIEGFLSGLSSIDEKAIELYYGIDI